MKRIKKTIIISLSLMMLILLCACGTKSVDKVTSSDEVYIRKIENIPDDFIMGVDLSSVIALENSGVKFYDYEGNEEDIFKVLAESGITHIRVRVWNDPFDESRNGYGGGNCDINTALEISKRAKQYGLKMIIDFHYSDFWADPGKQMAPKAWKGMEIEDKAAALYEYTKESLNLLKKEKIDVAMVQIGNETNGAMAGEKIWMNIIYHLMANGSKAIREVYPKALIAVHFANPEKEGAYLDYAKKLNYYDLDYDVFASSYYPYWHGSLENLTNVLNSINELYDKKTMIIETSYAYTPDDSDFSGNTISNESAVTKNYPYSIQGQTNAILDVIDTAVNKIKDCLGICYWEGAWITVGTSSYEENSKLWEEYGSGWASSYASEYDPDDAGKYYGGSAVDNQAFFDSNGHPLESLKLFELCKKGNLISLTADSIEDSHIQIDLNDEIVLPKTVNAIMSDNSKQEIDVEWDDFDHEKMKNNGVKTYQIHGVAGNQDAYCYVSMIEYNYLQNYSFEADENKTAVPASWILNKIKDADELYVEDKQTDSLSGNRHYHFWSKNTNTIEFELEQEVKDLEAGKYSFSISIMGGDSGESDIYAYVKANDQLSEKAPMKITSYNSWDTGKISFEYNGTDDLKVGIYVKCAGEGNGAWGKIDDGLLNRTGD
ncbi:MAG: glycosyl hydrolase 53 family protein [Erysipelotrichaceae bacterium]|nr:glycosyl hydrolase 53 family protein [Erysipelotrichaceae bacterium]